MTALIMGVLLLGVEARSYEPGLPNNLLGYVRATDFNPELVASVKTVRPNGIILLDVRLQAEGATEMKVSLEPQFTHSRWQKYTPVIRDWQVTPQSKLITLYAVFKRKNTLPALGSSISPIVHYTLDLNNLVRVIERNAYGYMDWTEHRLVIEETYLPRTEQVANLEMSGAEKRAKENLELMALRAMETVRVTASFTIADLVSLDTKKQDSLREYLSLLSITSIDYGRALPDGRPVPIIGEGKGDLNLSPHSSVSAKVNRLGDNINLFRQIPPEIRLTASLPLIENPKIFSEQGRAFVNYQTLYKEFQPRSSVRDTVKRNTTSVQSYEGLVLDLRETGYAPNLYPRVITKSGQVILSSALYDPPEGNDTQSVLQIQATEYVAEKAQQVPYVQYVRNLATTDFPLKTLFIKPLEVYEPLQDIAISEFYGSILLSSDGLQKQIANGAFWIVVD